VKADGLLPAETKLRSSKYLNNLIEQAPEDRPAGRSLQPAHPSRS
jgi:hypothetical protein